MSEENPKTNNPHVKQLNKYLDVVCENICFSQSRRLNYIKTRCADRFSEYIDEIIKLVGLLVKQKEKDLPEADARGLTNYDLIKPVVPIDQNNPFINLLTQELYEINVELCYGPSSKNTAGLHQPDLRMIDDKVADARSILADGRIPVPPIHFPYGRNEGVRGSDASE